VVGIPDATGGFREKETQKGVGDEFVGLCGVDIFGS